MFFFFFGSMGNRYGYSAVPVLFVFCIVKLTAQTMLLIESVLCYM